MTVTIAERKALPPIQCQPWCISQDGHPDELDAEDQYCSTEMLRVNLSLEPQMYEGEVELDYYDIYVAQPAGAEPRLFMTRGGWAAPAVTPAEAQQLVEVVQLLLGQIEAAR